MKKILMILCVMLTVSLAGCTEEKVVDNKEPAKEEAVENKDTKKPDETNNTKEDEQVTIKVCVPDEQFMKLEEKEVKLDALDPELILNVLKESYAVSEECKINSVKVDGDNVYIDLNEEYSTFIKNMGTSGEYMSIGSIVNTFTEAYSCEAAKITSAGEVIVTGHAAYDGYLTRFALEP